MEIQHYTTEVRLCRCGCGGQLPERRAHSFIKGHRKAAELKYITEAPKRLCACECGEFIVNRPEHFLVPPKFILGHGANTFKRFFKEHSQKHVCACGCGEFIEIIQRHQGKRGIPKLKHKHVLINETKRYKKLHETIDISVKPIRKNNKAFEFNFWQRVILLRKYNFKCTNCSWDVDYTKLEFDHIIPVHLGGLPTIENGQILCRSCHKDKSAKEISTQMTNNWSLVKASVS